MSKRRRPAHNPRGHPVPAAPPVRPADPRALDKKARRVEAQAARARDRRHDRRVTLLKRWGIGVGIAAVIALVGFGLVQSTGGGVAVSGDLRPGGTLQSFTLPALQNSGTVSYDSLKDRPLVLNFFASWCPYCVGEMPGFQRVHQALGSKVTILGVSQSDNSKQASIDLANRTGITYQTAFDGQGALFRAFGGLSMPVTVFVKPGGQIAEIHAGALGASELEGLIVQYFGPTYAATV